MEAAILHFIVVDMEQFICDGRGLMPEELRFLLWVMAGADGCWDGLGAGPWERPSLFFLCCLPGCFGWGRATGRSHQQLLVSSGYLLRSQQRSQGNVVSSCGHILAELPASPLVTSGQLQGKEQLLSYDWCCFPFIIVPRQVRVARCQCLVSEQVK